MPARLVTHPCLIPVLLSSALLAGCSPGTPVKAPVDTAKIVDSIKSDEVRWNADWRSGDPVKVAAHYAADAVVMSPGVKAAVGAAAIKASIDEAVEQQGFGLTFASDRVDVAASGDLAAAHGSYRQTSTNPKTGSVDTESGSYVTIYKPGPDGVWKAVWDINTPAAPAENPVKQQ